ncbi:MAG: GAF domain-containing protein [Bryobacterales bacterium]|nr:GAF domain-containing protein [Bryobacterales bacterium]
MSSAPAPIARRTHDELRLAASDLIGREQSPAGTLMAMAALAAQAGRARIARILALDETRSMLVALARSDFGAVENATDSTPFAGIQQGASVLHLAEFPVLTETLRSATAATLRLGEPVAEQYLIESTRQLGLAGLVKSVALIPLRVEAECLGLVEVSQFEEEFDTVPADLLERMEAIAPHAAILTDRLRLHQTITYRHELYERMEDATGEIKPEFREDRLRSEVLRGALDVARWTAGGLYRNDPIRRELVLLKTLGLDQPLAETLPHGSGLIGQVVETRKAAYRTGYSTWEGRERAFDPFGFQTLAAFPLNAATGVEYVLFLGDVTGRRTHLETEKEILTRFVNRAAQRIEAGTRPLDPGLLMRLHRIVNDIHSAPTLDQALYLTLTGATAAYGLEFNRAQIFLLDTAAARLVGRTGVGQLDEADAHAAWEQARSEGTDAFQTYCDRISTAPPVATPVDTWTKSLRFDLNPDGGGAFESALMSASPVIIERHEVGSLPRPYVEGLRVVSPVVLVPLVTVGGGAIGVIAVDSAFTGDPIDPHIVPLLSTLAQAAANAVEKHARVERTRRTEMLFKETSELALGLSPADTLRQAAQRLMVATGATWAKMIGLAEYGRIKDMETVGITHVFRKDTVMRPQGMTKEVIASGKGLFLPNVYLAINANPSLYLGGTVSAACLPMGAGKKTNGVVWLHYDSRREFRDEERAALEWAITRIGEAYEGACRAQFEKRFDDAVREMSKALAPRPLVERIVELAMRTFNADTATFWSYERGQFILESMHSIGLPQLALRARPPQAGGVTEKVLTEGYVGMEVTGQHFIAGFGVTSYQGVALRADDEPVGVLYVSYMERSRFNEQDRERLEAFAAHAAQALRKARLLDQLRHQIEVAAGISSLLVRQQGDVRATLQFVAAGIRDLVGCGPVTVWGYDEDAQLFLTPVTQVGVGKPGQMNMRQQPSPNSVVQAVMAGGRRIIPKIEDDAQFRATRFVRDEGIKSCFATPLRVGERRLGVLFVNYLEEHQFTQAEEEAISMFARLAAVAIRNAELLQGKQREIEQQADLVKLTTALLGQGEVETMLEEAVRVARSALRADLSHVVRRSKSGQLEFVAADGWEQEIVGKALDPMSYAGYVIRNRQTIFIPDVAKELRITVPSVAGEERIVSGIATPILDGNEVIGALLVCTRAPRLFTQDDKAYLELIAKETAIALRRARELETSTRQRALWNALFDVAKEITGNPSHDPRQIFGKILESAVDRVIAAQGVKGVIATFQMKHGDELEFAALYPTQDFPDLEKHLGRRRSLSATGLSGITARVAITGHGEIVRNVLKDPDYIALLPDIRSEIATPVRVGDRVIGVLNLESDQEDAFDSADLDALKALADLAVVAMQRAEMAAKFILSLATVSHELDNQLKEIDIQIEHLREEASRWPAGTASSLALMENAIDEEKRMIANLRDAAQREAGQLPHRPECCSIASVVRECVESFESRAAAARQIVSAHIPATDELMAQADRESIARILRNLISNAIKFSGEGRQTRVSAARQNGAIIVTVADQGCGIPEAEHQRIFEIFHRVHSSASKPGMGIGLAICRELVERHGGRIEVKSQTGKGAEFVFTLPGTRVEESRP